MSNIIRTILGTILVVIGLFAVASVSGTTAYASDVQTSEWIKLQQAFKPHRDSVTGEMIARVNNWSTSAFSGWICAQEKSAQTGKMYHRGCLKAELAPRWSGGEWSMQFGVPTQWGGAVYYTYQGADGVWRSVAPAAN